MECFIAFRPTDSIDLLQETLEAWDIEGIEPVMLDIRVDKPFELTRRVMAENVAHGDYILAQLDTAPVEPDFAELATRQLATHPDHGLISVRGVDTSIHSGVVICRQGVVDKWPKAESNDYVFEHVDAYKLKGYRTFLCSEIHCRPLKTSLPS